MGKRFEVKSQRWVKGELQSLLTIFNTLVEAVHHARSGHHHVAKVYDSNGFLVHTENKTHESSAQTYA